MNLLKLTERAAHTLQCCRQLMADVGSEERQRALVACLDTLRKHPPDAPPIVVGLFNQSMALADGVIHAIARERTSPTPEGAAWVQRSLVRLQDCVESLHAAAAHRAGMIGRRAPVSSIAARAKRPGA